jgi:carbon-monoxide dehydrogenase small subunit
MTSITINGETISRPVEPRTHLADFLREANNLTGTHLGCEHGVCGACTLLIDGAPARSCIAFAALCDGAAITTIEGLEHDPVIIRLRAAFTAEHALQCGFCTPGMLVTARDIVRRLPEADEARIRLELAGNLCRCTGYDGIVRAIRRVLDERLNLEIAAAIPLAAGRFSSPARPAAAPAAAVLDAKAKALDQTIRLALPVETVLEAIRNPELIARCVPGLTLTSAEGGDLAGELKASFGPISARFSGTATITYEGAGGAIAAEGRDRLSQTRLNAAADFVVEADDEESLVRLSVSYSLRGPLAQLARAPIVNLFVSEMLTATAANLQARLLGHALVREAPNFSPLKMLLNRFSSWLRRLF